MDLTRRSALQTLAVSVAAVAKCWAGGVPRWRSASPKETDAFLRAVIDGDLDVVKTMLQQTPGLATSKDAEGLSALIHARLAGHDAIAEAILETGIRLDIAEAAMVEDWDRFELLASDQPSLCNTLHPIGGTPLYAAAIAGSRSLWRLRAAGCRPDLAPAGGTGLTPARAAVNGPDLTAAWVAAADLLSNGSDVNAPQHAGSSVLHGAVRRQSEPLVRLAIRKGADVAATDAEGRTPAALAAEIGWHAGVRLLEEHQLLPRDHRASRFAFDRNRKPIQRADLSAVSKEQQSRTTGNSHTQFETVRELVSKDSRLVFSLSMDDELPIEAAAHMGNHQIMKLLLEHGSPYSLPTAVSLCDEEFVRFLLDRDPQLIDERGAHDYPVMWYLVLGGATPDFAAMLCDEYEVSLDQESMGNTALHWCIQRDRYEMAEWLIANGADLNPVGYKWDRSGQTPLALAEKKNATTFVQLLKRAGAHS